MLRAMGHILYLTGCLADEAIEVTEEQALEELRQTEAHWSVRAETEAVSSAARTQANTILTAISEAIHEYPEWATTDATQNIRDLANRIMAYAAQLDRELVGLPNSDPGSSL